MEWEKLLWTLEERNCVGDFQKNGAYAADRSFRACVIWHRDEGDTQDLFAGIVRLSGDECSSVFVRVKCIRFPLCSEGNF